ncbi:MAG: DNA-processing protein DprA [Clostridia bacterium]|nr:DNA-processing protein DprA [Clostridia bacterium]
MDSRLYWIWLQQALPLGCTAMCHLLDTFGHAETVYRADKAALVAAGVSPAHCQRLEDKQLDKARRILDRVLEAGDWVLTPEDALYPFSLRHIPGCPAALYGRGVLPDLDSTPAVTVVGTRHATPAGMQEARALAAGLAAGGAVVISGGAVGIDAAVHAGALDAQGRTLVVLACPIPVNYPVENAAMRQRVLAQGGLLISEFPHGEPYRCDFEVRNRLLAGLSQAVCLAETPARSGARITARLAREQGRDVFALPGALTGHHYDGAHSEIQRGAALVMRATDILQELMPRFPGMLNLTQAEEAQKRVEQEKQPAKPEKPVKEKRPRRKKEKQPEQPVETPQANPASVTECPDTAGETARQVFSALTEAPRPVDELAGETGLSIPVLLAALTELEMLGCAENSAGQQYKRR